MSRDHRVWDRHAIMAELRRHRSSLAAVGRGVGLKRQTMYWALISPHLKANAAIADALGRQLCELWPDWFDEDGKLISKTPLPRPRLHAEPIPRGSSASSPRQSAA
ncbi:helix-turn-helix domain-containing protein [Methylosinus sp. H3A]|uniref:helix-turn-helix domain-containing protein n=1 Tax=Methylosinus sp. H3A TaxID=2785786 RepID=UPI0018C25906|nr:helix-turn-helix domain-containing protein [Methylosinus sp. H3A]MBG0809892.1 helix-turn-helix domain-containing protein [Methylosinus sp. H3A]